MKPYIEDIIKKVAGGFLLGVGVVAMVTPFTPGATWLIILGLEFLGLRILFWDKIKSWFEKKNPPQQ